MLLWHSNLCFVPFNFEACNCLKQEALRIPAACRIPGPVPVAGHVLPRAPQSSCVASPRQWHLRTGTDKRGLHLFADANTCSAKIVLMTSRCCRSNRLEEGRNTVFKHRRHGQLDHKRQRGKRSVECHGFRVLLGLHAHTSGFEKTLRGR